MDKFKWEEFRFIASQLGVIDDKAKSILQINAILIAITNIGFFIERDFSSDLKIIAGVANLLILVSTAVCLKTIWIKWSTGNHLIEIPSITNVIKTRDSKTKFLHASLVLLGSGLVVLVILLLVRFIT